MASMTQINLFRHSSDAYDAAPGATLFAEGEAGDAMFAVVAGEVEVRVGERVVEVVGEGGIVGEMALIDTRPRSASAVVIEPARVVRIDERNFMFLVQEHPTFALSVMRVMAERLRRANEG
jgi:CRP/FNR family cyclic AMP-dependent transcriptional regulator